MIVIPHCYDLKWAKDTNALLRNVYSCPNIKETGYLLGKKTKYALLYHVAKSMRSRNEKDLFFVNLMEDFSFDFIKTTPVENMYGIFVCTNHIDMVGSDKRMACFEDAVASVCKKVFVLTEFHKAVVPFTNTKVVGLPTTFTIKPPSKSDYIIWNHRLHADKFPLKAYELHKEFRDKLIFSVPKYCVSTYNKMKSDFKIFIEPKPSTYNSLLNKCGFGISFCKHELFGVSIIDGIANGLMYFVPSEYAGYYDYVCKENMFSCISELEDKIRYYTLHLSERYHIVLECQKKIERYMANNWIETIKKCIKHGQ